MNCQAKEISLSKKYCTLFTSYNESSYSYFFLKQIIDSWFWEPLCTEYGFGADLKRFFYSLANDWFVMDEKYWANPSMHISCKSSFISFQYQRHTSSKPLCEFLAIKNGITSKWAILPVRISFQRSQREYGEGRIGTAHWAQVPRCKDAQNKQITMKQH